MKRRSVRFAVGGAIVAGLLVLVVTGTRAETCGDADDSGAVTVTDGVGVLRAAADLDGPCREHTAACDVDGSGVVTVTDGVKVLRVAADLPETLTCATPAPGSTATATPARTATPKPTATPTATPEPTPADVMRVFATSTTHDGSFGGVAGADALCATRAATAGLSGTFKAWLSASDGSPATTFTTAAVPYVLVDGAVVAMDWDDLVDGTLTHAIDEDENGDPVNGDVWTGTDTLGNAAAGATCSDWSSRSGSGQCGNTGQVGSGWTAFSLPSCSLSLHLYCFEQ